MLAAFIFGSLLAVLAIDRFSYVATVIPWLFDLIYYSIFPKTGEEEPTWSSEEHGGADPAIEGEEFFKISAVVDDALTDILESVYRQYMDPIDRILLLSKDTHLTVRKCVRHFFCDLALRARNVDIQSCFTDDLYPKIVNHLINCHKADKIGEQNEKLLIQKIYQPDQVHIGIFSENSEDGGYLHSLSESILRLGLRSTCISSKLSIVLLRSVVAIYVLKPLVDFFCTPQNLRNLIHYALTTIPCQGVFSAHGAVSSYTRILYNFVQRPLTKYRSVQTPPKIFMLRWDHLQSNPSLLYIFMQVLKRSAYFKYPRLCIALEEWKSRMDRLENYSNFKQSDIKELLNEAATVYQVFLSPESLERVAFNNSTVAKMKEFNFEDCTIENLKNISIELNHLHEVTTQVLKTECLDIFYRSPEFFILCFGDRPKMTNNITAFHLAESRKDLALTKNSTVLPESYSTSSLQSNCRAENDFKLIESEDEILSDIVSVESNSTEQTSSIDLSKLNVEIKSLRSAWKKDSKVFLFVIDVSSIDDDNHVESWRVERQHKEFYGLENRLKRFHGGRISQFLPARKAMSFKNQDYFLSYKKPFQEYLKNLIRNPFLKHSSMLHSFLAKDVQGTFSSYFSKTLSIDTGRALQSVIGTLSTEKGKYIDSFINTFAMYVETTKPKVASKTSWAKLKRKYAFLKEQSICSTHSNLVNWCKPQGTTVNIIQETIKAFNIIVEPRRWFVLLTYIFYTLFGTISDLILNRFLKQSIKKYSSHNYIASYIKMLETIVVSPDKSFQGDIEESKLNDVICNKYPISLLRHVSPETVEETVYKFVRLLRFQVLNKQLVYCMLDVIVSKLYPELTETKTEVLSKLFGDYN